MSIIVSLLNTISVLLVSSFLSPLPARCDKVKFGVGFSLFFLAKLFIIKQNYFSFILTFIILVLFQVVVYMRSIYSACITAFISYAVLLCARVIVASYHFLWNSEYAFSELRLGFSDLLLSFFTLIAAMLLVLLCNYLNYVSKRFKPRSYKSPIALVLLNGLILVNASYIMNRFLRYLLTYSENILAIPMLRSFFFAMILLIIVVTILCLFGINLYWFINEKYLRIKTQADFDPLTGVYNRRAGLANLNDVYLNAKRTNSNFVLCFFDVNNLKVVNDRFGHSEGDRLIVTVTRICKNALRTNDFLIRYGGDEFIIVFNNCALNEAKNAWTRITKEFDHLNYVSNSKYLISASAGYSSFKDNPTLNLNELIDLADSQMYKTKRSYKEYTGL